MQGQGLLVGDLTRGLEIQAEKNAESETGDICVVKVGKTQILCPGWVYGWLVD